MNKRIVILLVMTLIFSGCYSSNEDPTNIEMEVLRASLLEKELRIDELQNSIEGHQTEKKVLGNKVEELEAELTNQLNQKDQLLEGQEQILNVQDSKAHYYQVFDDDLYLLQFYINEAFEYEYEELYRYHVEEEKEVIYKGNDIQFAIDHGTGHVFVLDQDKINIFTDDLELIYEDVVDLNDPLIDLRPTLIINDQDFGKSYVLLTKNIQEDTESLLALCVYNYRASDEVFIDKYYLNTNNYVFSDERAEILYEEVSEEGISLYRINLNTANKELLINNNSSSLNLTKTNGYIYYFDEESNGIIRYDGN